MNEIRTLREIRPVPPPAEMEALRSAAREQFLTGMRPRPGRQRWRLPVLAGGLTAAAAGTAAVALAMSSGPVAAPAQHGAAGHARTVFTTAWTVREDADGTVTVYLREYAHPAALQQTLRADGINAIVRAIKVRTETITPPGRPRGSRKPLSRFVFPACVYATTDNAPAAVQRAVLTFRGVNLPAFFVIHQGAMPPGSALLLPFMAGVPRSWKNDGAGVMAMKPVVLNNDMVPACVPVPPKSAPSFVPKAKQPITPKAKSSL
jgi:hypothetical protein